MFKIHRVIATTAVTLTVTGNLAISAAGAAQASTPSGHFAPVRAGHVLTHSPDPILRSGINGMHTDSAASCGLENIGSPGNYGYAGYYAGQVEQMWDSCTGVVWAHWQWAGSFQTGPYAGATVGLAIGSPYQRTDWVNNAATTSSKDVYFGGWNAGGDVYNIVSPDDWRAGAEINNDGCVQWGTLHWYGGQDWDGPQGGCFGHDQPAPAAGQG